MDHPARAVPEEIRGRAFNILWIAAKSSRNNPRRYCDWSNADFGSQDEIWCSPTAASRTVSQLARLGYITTIIRNGSDREIHLTDLGWTVIENKEREISDRKSARGQGSADRKGLARRQAVEPKPVAIIQAPLAERSASPGKSPGTPGKTPGLISTPEAPQNSCTPEPVGWQKIKALMGATMAPAFVRRFLEPLTATLHGDELHLAAPNSKIRNHVAHRYLPAIRQIAESQNFARVTVS